MTELRAIEGGRNGNGGLSKVGSAVVAILALLGGTMLIGWRAASAYQADLASIRAEQDYQGIQIDLLMEHFHIEKPKRRER